MNDIWNGIYGQNPAKEILTNLLESTKIPHAFLFQGPSGLGKEFTALRFAQALNSFFSTGNIFQINNSIANLTEPYIKYIIPLPRGKNENDESGPIEKLSLEDIQILKDELDKRIANPYYKIVLPKANTIKINSIRDIKKFLFLDYSDIKFRVILISDAHLMNEASQNALLKNLEEPPAGVVFILSTPFPSLLKETIRSRCWVINFQPLSNEDIKKILIHYFNVDEEVADEIALFAGGSITIALSFLEHDFELLREKTILILRYSLGKKYHSALNEISTFLSDNDPEFIRLLIQMIIIWINDLQKFRFNSGEYFFKRHQETLEKFNKRFPDVNLNEIVFKLDNLSAIIQNNININLIAINLIFELSSLTTVKK